MKTRLQWFNELPSNISEIAIANSDTGMLTLTCNSMTHAIEGAFFWSDSPEGMQYWKDVYMAYNSLETALELIKELEHA